MRCHLAALCDAANISVEGKINILGEFDTVFAPSFPAIHPQMLFVAKLKVGEADLGEHRVELRVVDEDMNLVTKLEGHIRIPPQRNPGSETGLPIMLQVMNAAFQEPGIYTFFLLVDGKQMAELPLHLRLATLKPKEGPHGAVGG